MAAPVTQVTVTHDEMANAIRVLAMDAVEKAKSGHPGCPWAPPTSPPCSLRKCSNMTPLPRLAGPGSFCPVAGHGSMLLYALLYLTGEKSMTIAELQRFRQLGSITPGHPNTGIRQGGDDTGRSARASPRRLVWRLPNGC